MVDVGSRRISVRLRRSTRAKRYLLKIPTDGSEPVLTMPAGGTLATAQRFADRHAGWLAARLAERPEPVAFAPGAIVPLRGSDHRIVAAGRLRGLIELGDDAGVPVLIVPGAPEHIARRLTDWLRSAARADLDAAVARHTAVLGRTHTGLTIRDTRSRWGSCTSSGRLSFSWRLVLAPPEILDYVAAHEVAHLAEMNHGPAFWRLCRQLAPQTDAARLWLRTNGARLHLYG